MEYSQGGSRIRVVRIREQDRHHTVHMHRKGKEDVLCVM